jgi:glycosyltransferase involved in cell wall biosynthesis
MTSKPRILVLIKGLGLGGAERLLVDALPWLDRASFDYEFAYLVPWKNFLAGTIADAGHPVRCLGLAGPARTPLVLARLVAILRDRRVDLVHAHLPAAGILARVAGRLRGVPVIYTEHNFPDRYHPLTRFVNNATYGSNRTVLTVSGEITAALERLGLARRTRVVTLPNGVPAEAVRAEAGNRGDARRELGIATGATVVGTVAVFRRQKRLADWVAVAQRVLARHPDVVFLIAGHGPEEAALRASVRAAGLEGRILLPGFRPDGRRVIGAMDVFLMTSEYEGLPVAVLESMALGVPVVATAVGGVPEAVRDGLEGLLAPVGGIELLAGHVERLAGDPELRRRLGESAARRVAEKFHIRRMAAAVENVYRETLGGESRG